MGTISQVTVADYPILYNKNDYYNEAVEQMFTYEDFVEEIRPNQFRNKLVWGDAYAEDPDNYSFKGYRQTAETCLKRLEIYGINRQSATELFELAKKSACDEEVYDFGFSKLTYGRYLAVIKDIIFTKDIHYDQLYANLRESLISDELFFPGLPFNVFLFSVLSVVKPDDIVEYDLTELIENGYISVDRLKSIQKEKIIIMTEGKTDSEFISASLRILYPELFHYYHFIDFSNHALKPESNASNLVKLITTLVAINIKQRIVAIFDNDTAGISEFNRIPQDRLPENIKVITLPAIRLANRYPTVGPTGLKQMNVNGLACGIELFLGMDVLTDDGKLIPIQWKGYNDKMGQYQGELSKKEYVQLKFREKLSQAQQVNSEEMLILLHSIMDAFKEI
jgi:hypothetical protein